MGFADLSVDSTILSTIWLLPWTILSRSWLIILAVPTLAFLVPAVLACLQAFARKGMWLSWFDRELGSAYILSDWLLLEAARSQSLDGLWSEFESMVDQLGFGEVLLESTLLQKHWQSAEAIHSAYPLRVRYRLGVVRPTVLGFVASRAVMDGAYFRRVSLLAAKTWVRAARLWAPLPESIGPAA